VRELQRVIDIARTLKPYFKRATRHLIVVSVGGFTQDRPLPLAERAALYERVAQSLSELDADDVEIVPQTLPPFPWYFGGQFFGNLFVDPQDTVSFCQAYGYRVCLDVSHSKLATNHRQTLFSDFVNQVGPFAAHLHIVDAAGVDGEGLQVGEGEIDFATLAAQLDRVAPQASFIPEIWQGHKNGGAGFWIALDRLEKWF
jgi:N-acetylneuraminate synthase